MAQVLERQSLFGLRFLLSEGYPLNESQSLFFGRNLMGILVGIPVREEKPGFILASAKMLMEFKADLNGMRDSVGLSILDISMQSGNEEVTQYLKSKGARE